MTTKTNQEIDYDLALAIGYTPDRVRYGPIFQKINAGWCVQVLNDNSRRDGPIQYGGWQRFDHKDPDVFAEIGERFDAFPLRFDDGAWFTSIPGCDAPQDPQTNPRTATALAVISLHKGKI